MSFRVQPGTDLPRDVHGAEQGAVGDLRDTEPGAHRGVGPRAEIQSPAAPCHVRLRLRDPDRRTAVARRRP